MLATKKIKIANSLCAFFGRLDRSRLERPAFTILELMVVIAILALMSASSVILFSGKERQNIEQAALENLLTAIREAESKAMITEKCLNKTALFFGVRRKNNSAYEKYCQAQDGSADIEEVKLPESLTLTQGIVEFAPPEPVLRNYQEFRLGGEKIIINQSGGIDIQ